MNAIALNETELAFAADYEAAKKRLPGAGRAAVSALREAGLEKFTKAGLPHRRVEAWKYTDLRRVLSRHYPPAEPFAGAVLLEGMAADPFTALDAHVMVFVNGFFRADLSRLSELPAGVEVSALAALLEKGGWAEDYLKDEAAADAPVDGLNLALMGDGAAIRIGEGVTLDKPLHLLFIGPSGEAAAGRAAHARTVVFAGKGSKATLLESHIGTHGEARLATVGMEIILEEDAELHHIKAQVDGAEALHLAASRVRLAERSVYEGFVLTSGAALSRNEVTLSLMGPQARAHISGAYLLGGEQHCDNTTFIDHAVPDCESREVFKGVIADKGRGVFQGKILVRQDAQRTDGHQLSQALLLSDHAEVDAKPELEIYADDVKCSHGATAGALDEESVFYLASRGLDRAEARALLIAAFVREALSEVEEGPVRDALDTVIAGWLERNRADVMRAAIETENRDHADTDA